MTLSDIVLLAVNNLKRNTMRTVLTTLGVAVGIGSLASLVSFGQGISGNVTKAMEGNDIFTGLSLTSRDIDFDNIGLGRSTPISDKPIVPLNDSTLDIFRQWDEVAMVYPEIIKHATVKLADRQISLNLKGVPVEMKDFAPFSTITHGRFFEKPDEPYVIITRNMLMQMEIDLPLDSLVGRELEIVTKVFDHDKINLISSRSRELPIKNESTFLKIIGVVEGSSFTGGMFSSGVFLTPDVLELVPSINIRNVYDIIEGTEGLYGKYSSAHIRVRDHQDLKPVRNRVEQLGFQVFSIGDKLDDIERLFFMLDSILAAIGTVALLVSVLGIVNTLIMAIYERRKEIGIMKSLGATMIQIKLIFYFEAAFIGALGGVMGVIGGKLASQAASSLANSQIGKIIDCEIEYFQFSWGLVFLSILFSILISVLASIYPANKASMIDPLDALRRE
ncbi:MAG: ABC transporter permease [Bacteroidales bacterium]|nr:ABC transporter permease [Bacteroidales bacterium]